jgi:hypothetical protein
VSLRLRLAGWVGWRQICDRERLSEQVQASGSVVVCAELAVVRISPSAPAFNRSGSGPGTTTCTGFAGSRV